MDPPQHLTQAAQNAATVYRSAERAVVQKECSASTIRCKSDVSSAAGIDRLIIWQAFLRLSVKDRLFEKELTDVVNEGAWDWILRPCCTRGLVEGELLFGTINDGCEKRGIHCTGSTVYKSPVRLSMWICNVTRRRSD